MLSNDEPLSTPLLDDEISPQLNIAEPYSHSACTRLTRHHHNQLSSDFSQVRDWPLPTPAGRCSDSAQRPVLHGFDHD